MEIKQCTHDTTPVPMSPLCPFMGDIECRLEGGSGIDFHAHGLGKNLFRVMSIPLQVMAWSALQPKSQTYLERNIFLGFNNRYNARMTDGWVSKIVSSTLTLLRISSLEHIIQQMRL